MENKKSYNIVLNSQQNISSNTNSQVEFGFDWSVIPKGSYDVHFTFVTNPMNLSTTDVAVININFGSSTVYTAGNLINAYTTNYVGIAKPYLISTTSYLLSEDNTNPPIYLNNRPNNNIFNVTINNSTNNALFVPTTGSMANWILNLKFIPV